MEKPRHEGHKGHEGNKNNNRTAKRAKRIRNIDYLRSARGEIWMLTLYGKNVREDIPAHLLKQMKETIDDE